ncbi:MAG: magnesium chelatase ATPase subunit I [Desulfuromonas sp.]|nr:MAG: magnesium chelatase ATPase subunit I [Desulfuromonas sp.]
MERYNFPFSAIIGQDALKTALLLNAVDPIIGGVLIRGDKGAGKSTSARALAALLPSIKTIQGCPYHCDPDSPDAAHDECRNKIVSGSDFTIEERPTPMVEFPLSATEDRIVGSLNIETALKQGESRFDPGLLAAANRGILYVDEVNLLPDHLVDLLLDAAASGVNIVEREAIRFVHPARFILIGTMNPEEGELRPQFLDRFGLCVHVDTITDPDQRAEIIKRHLAFEQDPTSFLSQYEKDEETLHRQIISARSICQEVSVPDSILSAAVDIAINAEAQGHRAEIVLIRAARALTALLDRSTVGNEELHEAARLVLPHRLKRGPLDRASDLNQKIEDLLAKSLGIKSPSANTDLAEVDLDFVDNHDFPGSAAAGSMLFTYLKKKVRSSGSNRMTASS